MTRFQLQDDMENDLCSEDPWLVLHKIDSPTKMRYIGNRIQVATLSGLFQGRRRLRWAGLCGVDKTHLSPMDQKTEGVCASTVQACNFSDFDSTKIAPSIAPYVKQKGESADGYAL